MKRPRFLPFLGLLALVTLPACENQETNLTEPEVGPSFGKVKEVQQNLSADLIDAEIQALMESVNVQLEASGVDYRVAVAEWTGQEIPGRTVYASDHGPFSLGADFVPHDTRRPWSGPDDLEEDDITWAWDQTADGAPAGLTLTLANAAISNAMATWDGIKCADLPLQWVDDFGENIGLVAWEVTSGGLGSPFVFADIQHAGWELPFSQGILGVTFTYVFTSGSGYSDINFDGLMDTALREIYYNPNHDWNVNGTPGDIDVETVVLHEMGHGLSQGHFGSIFVIEANGKLKVAPRAVMNAIYLGNQRTLYPTDMAGHCSIWGDWPDY